jgi:hypothetical protein
MEEIVGRWRKSSDSRPIDGGAMPEYSVETTGTDWQTGQPSAEPLIAESVYAFSAKEAEKIAEMRAEKHGVDTSYFKYKASEISSDGTILRD